MQGIKEFDVMFPVRMTSQLKLDGQAAAQLLGMNFSQFVRQSIQRNIRLTTEVEHEVSQRLIREAMENS